MTNGEAWTKAVDLGTIATALLVIAFAVVFYISRSNNSHSSRKQKK